MKTISNLTDANVDYLGMWTADKATGLSFRSILLGLIVVLVISNRNT